MRTLILIVNLFLFLQIGLGQNQNNDAVLEERIIQLLDSSGAKENYTVVINQMLDLQKDLYNDILSDEFCEQFREEMLEKGYDEITKMVIPIYKKHFTLEEINGLIEFNESELGKSLTKKMPLIMAESMQAGAEWGASLGEEIAKSIIDSDDYKMNIESADCEKVKSGKFKIPIQGTDVISYIERKDRVQIESLNGEVGCKFKIKWVNKCKYEMTVITCKDESMNAMFKGTILTNNIYEVTDTGYKFISKLSGEDMMYKGEAFTIKKSNSKM